MTDGSRLMTRVANRCGAGLGLLLALEFSAGQASAVDTVYTSPDITVELDQAGGGTFFDEDVAADDLAGTVLFANLGILAVADEVVGYELLPGGDQLLCFDEAVGLSATFFPRPGDVIRYDGTSYTLEFDATATGVPDGVVCDAVTLDPGGSLLISFDSTFELTDGGGTTWTIHDEDLLRVTGPTTFSIFFDGSAAGIPDRLDVDGAHLGESGDLILSFDVSGVVGGVDFDDDDLTRFSPGSGVWSLYLDLATRDTDWIAADADAVSLPEPGGALGLACGIGFLIVLGRHRARP
jgi:hypothetical protein